MLIKVKSKNSEELQVYSFNKNRISIGSSPGCDIVISDPNVASSHLAISQVGPYFYVQDLGSHGGSFIMNNKLRPGEKYQFATYFPVQIAEGISIHLSKDSLKATEEASSVA